MKLKKNELSEWKETRSEDIEKLVEFLFNRRNENEYIKTEVAFKEALNKELEHPERSSIWRELSDAKWITFPIGGVDKIYLTHIGIEKLREFGTYRDFKKANDWKETKEHFFKYKFGTIGTVFTIAFGISTAMLSWKRYQNATEIEALNSEVINLKTELEDAHTNYSDIVAKNDSLKTIIYRLKEEHFKNDD